MKKILQKKNFLLLCLLLLVTQMSMAGDWSGSTVTYNFANYPDGTNFTNGGTAATSSSGNLTILGDSYNQLDNRFAVSGGVGDSGNRWYIHNGGLYQFHGNTKDLSILNLHAGDKVTINWKNVTESKNITFKTSGQANGQNAAATVVSGTEYTISSNGTLDLSVGRYIAITSVKIYQDPSTWTAYFDRTECEAELIALDFQEPTLTYPNGAYVSYRVSNESLARFGGEAGQGDLTLLNTGKCVVYADVWYNGNYYQASYNLTIKADDATYVIDDDTYTLTGPGKLQERVVTGVPKMRMEFGENVDNVENVTMVRSLNNIPDPVATTIDVNGWRHIWANFNNYRVNPHQGTFYTFKPEGSGVLTVRGYLNRGSAYIVDADNLAPIVSELTSKVGVSQDSWTGANNMVGWAGDDITTFDGRTTALAERYNNYNEQGTMLEQQITGLANGHYTVKLYANAYHTLNNAQFQTGDQTIAEIYANNATTAIPAIIGSSFGSNPGFYTLTAEVTDGTLTIGLRTKKTLTNWHSIQISQLTLNEAASIQFTPVANIVSNSETQKLETTVNVVGGHTYYLYGNTPNTLQTNDWGVYQLSSFTFTPNFRYEDKSVVLELGETSAQQDLVASFPNVEYGYILKGDLTAATQDANTGYISNIQGEGGAVIVTATLKYNGVVTDYDYYVITVPYKNKVWNFLPNTENSKIYGEGAYPADMDQNLNWGVNYEVRTYDLETRALSYINGPVLTAQSSLDGDNAYWIGETAGLVVDAKAKTFGVVSTPKKDLAEVSTYNAEFGTSYTAEEFEELKQDGSFVDVYLKKMLNYGKDDVENLRFPAMSSGANLILPKLKAGTYVAIKAYRHAPKSGDYLHFTNVTDLDGNQFPNVGNNEAKLMVINQSWRGANVEAAQYGWIVLKVAQDGDVKINTNDYGWTHIKMVAVAEKFNDLDEVTDGFDTDLVLAKEDVSGTNISSASAVAPTVFDYDGTSLTYTFKNTKQSPYWQRQESEHVVKYYLEDIEGFGEYSGTNSASFANRVMRANQTISISENGELSVTGGHGTAVVVQKVMARNDSIFGTGNWESSNYVVDLNKTKITVRERGNTEQTYPYTWDFTNIVTDMGNSSYWTDSDNDGTYNPTTEAENAYLQNSELENSAGDDIDEFDGLGFLTSTDEGGVQSTGLDNIGIKTGGSGDKGLVIGDDEVTTVVVPDVPEGAIVYVRLTPGNGDNVTVQTGTGDAGLEGYTSSDATPTQTNIDNSGQNTYEIPGDGGDVNLHLRDVIEGIAVTNIFKECKFWDTVNTHDDGNADGQYCYNSDCHDLAINYPLTAYYTGTFMKAMYISGTTKTDDKVVANMVDIDITPSAETLTANGASLDATEGFGVLVYSIDKDVDHPLFVPAINATPDVTSNSGNLLRGVYEATSMPASGDDEYLYVFTNIYTDNYKQQTGIQAELPGFYKVVSSGTLKANRAYLTLSSTDAPAANTMVFITPADLLDGINEVTAGQFDAEGEFISISGMKFQGKPSTRGIYIQNGKKVLVK